MTFNTYSYMLLLPGTLPQVISLILLFDSERFPLLWVLPVVLAIFVCAKGVVLEPH